jgi:hypothetical protein
MENSELGELEALMAHKLGHLQSKDSLIGSAFMTSALPAKIILTVCKKVTRMIVKSLTLAFFIPRVFRKTLVYALLLALTAIHRF